MSEVKELEKQLDDIQGLKRRGEQATRLASNKDFRALILDGFCRDDAARLVQASADPFLDAAQRADSLGMAQASGHLKRFLSMQIVMGNSAERSIPEVEEALAEARADEGNL